jgi:lysozyme
MTNTFHVTIQSQLMRHEALRLKPYRCTADKLTIGVGRNIEDVGISKDEALYLLDNDIAACIADLRTFPWFTRLDAVRQRALVDMRFQFGPSRFRGFRKMLAALESGDYRTAAAEARDSKWARSDSPARARTVTAMIETGKEPV